MTVVFKNPRWPFVPIGVLVVFVGVGSIVYQDRIPPVVGVAFAALASYTWLYRAPRAGVFLSESHVVSRGLYTTHRAPIADLESIEKPEPVGCLVVHLTDGTKFELRGVPVRGWHRDRVHEALSQLARRA